MEGQAVTTNPWLIMAINMTVVFAVLIANASAQNEDEVVAAIVGAIVAMGYSSEQIASIRPTATSAKWRLEGRLSGRG